MNKLYLFLDRYSCLIYILNILAAILGFILTITVNENFAVLILPLGIYQILLRVTGYIGVHHNDGNV